MSQNAAAPASASIRTPASSEKTPSSADEAVLFETGDGADRRLDAAHASVPNPASPAVLEAGVPMSETARRVEAPNEDELLVQASQIAQHLRSQIGEMDRREQLLSSQLAGIDDERRQMRLWVQRFEVDMQQRAARIKSREGELSAKIAQSEKLVVELQAQADDLRNARNELAALRASLREQLEKELEGQRNDLQQSRQALEENRRLIAAQAEQNQREHEVSILESRKQLEQEWSRLHLRVAQDFEQERTQFELDRAAWTTQRDAETQRLARERAVHDMAIRQAEEEIEGRKRSLGDELQKQGEEHALRLAEERKKFEEERDRTRLQLQQERTVFENRARFQIESLLKSRDELEAARQEFRREQQQVRMQVERGEAALRLRKGQLDRYRALLDEREQSLQREQELLGRSRVSFESETERDRNRLRLERESWAQEKQAQRAELRRQQDLLTLHAENLEARRARLDHLRAELEETHRSTLEMRMAVEEAWAQLCQSSGTEAARQRVEMARNAFAEYYRHLQESLAVHRAELVEGQQAFQKQREEFAVERQTLALWMSERDDALRTWEDDLRQEADQLGLREAAWRVARDRWNQEKIGAEEIIRDLLRQLTHLNDLDGAGPRRREPLPTSTPFIDSFMPPLNTLDMQRIA